MQKLIRLYKSLANTEANWKPEDSMHANSFAFEREEEGTGLGEIEAILCECIFFFYNCGKTCGVPEIFPRFLKMSLIFLKSDI